MKIVGFMGEIASGKNASMDILAGIIRKEGFTVSTKTYSDKIKEIFGILRLDDPDRQQYQEMGMAINRLGRNVFTDAYYRDFTDEGPDWALIAGIRYPEQLKRWKDLDSGFTSIFVAAESRIRLSRYNQRRQDLGKSQLAWAEFSPYQWVDTEQFAWFLYEECEFQVDNNSGLDQLKQQLDFIWQQIKGT